MNFEMNKSVWWSRQLARPDQPLPRGAVKALVGVLGVIAVMAFIIAVLDANQQLARSGLDPALLAEIYGP